MLELPAPLLDYIHTITVENRSLAYLLVRKDGCLSKWGGNLSAYGFTDLQQGEYVGEQVFFLEGLLPLQSSPIFLSCIKTEYGVSADVHLFPSDEGDWVLLLDATLDELQRSLIQQGNDLSLIRQEHFRISKRYIENNDAENQGLKKK